MSKKTVILYDLCSSTPRPEALQTFRNLADDETLHQQQPKRETNRGGGTDQTASRDEGPTLCAIMYSKMAA